MGSLTPGDLTLALPGGDHRAVEILDTLFVDVARGMSCSTCKLPQLAVFACAVIVLQAIQAQLDNLAAGLFKASSGVQTVMESIQKGFPGPMLQSTLDGIKQQVSKRHQMTSPVQGSP